MNIGTAIKRLKRGEDISRWGWRMKKWLHLRKEDGEILLMIEEEPEISWCPSHEDLFADDWLVVPSDNDIEDCYD